MRAGILTLILGLLLTQSSAAQLACKRVSDLPHQVRGSRYLALGHWGYSYIDLLVSRGRLNSLQPLVQPYRRIDLARAIVLAEADSLLTATERDWLEQLVWDLEPELRSLRDSVLARASVVSGAVNGGAWAMSQRHRDPLRPTGKDAVFPFILADASAEFPNVVANLSFRWDEWLLNDPQFPDGRVGESHPNVLGFLDFGGRTREGYLELQIPYFWASASRINRNWGLPGQPGLLVSNYPYSYDQLSYRVGTECLSVTGFLTQLDEFPNNVKRWMSAHRLDWRIGDNLSIALQETVVYGGENRSLDFRISNPISLWLVGGFGKDYEDGPNGNNNLTELSAWWRPFGGVLTYLSFGIDDFPGGGTPSQHAIALGLQLPSLGPRLGLRFDYSQVAALTYRTSKANQVYAFRGIGLGRDMSDHDLFSLKLDWIPHRTLVLAPAAELLRRGEGDFRDPWPQGVTESGPTLFIGEVETTLRLAVAGQWLPLRWIWADFDLGQNFVWDVDHEAGENKSEFAGRIRLSLWTRGWWKL